MRRLFASVVLGCAACGGSVVASSTSDASSDVPADVITPGVDTGVTTVDGSDVADCEAAVTTLAPTFTDVSCTTTIRLLAKTNAIVGWNAQCGAPRPSVVTEAEARAAYAPFAAGGDVPPSDPSALAMLRDGSAGDAFIFYGLFGDYGALAAVSARRGDVAFYGTVVWGGSGRPHAPATWRTGPETLASCSFLDFPTLARIDTADLKLDDARVAAARDLIGGSPILHAIRRTQATVSAVVTVYPVDVGYGTGTGLSPERDELLVFLESAALD